MIEQAFFCLQYELSFESANVENTDTGVRHTVIKARNNKIEQGENNALFYVCVRSYLGGKKYFLLLLL